MIWERSFSAQMRTYVTTSSYFIQRVVLRKCSLCRGTPDRTRCRPKPYWRKTPIERGIPVSKTLEGDGSAGTIFLWSFVKSFWVSLNIESIFLECSYIEWVLHAGQSINRNNLKTIPRKIDLKINRLNGSFLTDCFSDFERGQSISLNLKPLFKEIILDFYTMSEW